MRIVLLVGAAVLMLWSSPTTAQPGLPSRPMIPLSQAITNVTLLLQNDNANGAVFGGLATGAGGFGVVGLASNTSSANFGVAGATNSDTGTGVFGLAFATTCPNVMPPVSLGQTCVGVAGQSLATSGSSAGVAGLTQSSNGAGVFGQATSGGGVGVGGVATATSGQNIGVFGRTDSTGGGLPFPLPAFGVFGHATAASGPTIGVGGQSDAPSGIAVRGDATATSGGNIGVLGRTNSDTGNGVFGVSTASTCSNISPQTCAGVVGLSQATSGTSAGVAGIAESSKGAGVFGQATNGGGVGLLGVAPTSGGGFAGKFLGPVAITCSPAPCLFVNGTPIADLAEDMPVARPVSPGDVVVLTRGQSYGIAPAAQAYDTRVAGIVSTAPRVRFGIGQRKAVPVAMVGVVKAKATAANGAIEFGDLLTTSPVAGHLMRCEAVLRCVGAIVGKALEPLAKGEQSILVLLWRQ